MKFDNIYSKRGRFHCEAGSPVRITFAPHYDENGHMELVVKGKENTYDYIQSFADEGDVTNLIKRYMAGDETVMNRVQSVYADVSNAPKNLAEALNIIADARHDFDRLPPEIREKFNFSVEEFVAQVGTPQFFDKLSIDNKNVIPDNSGKEEKPAEQ